MKAGQPTPPARGFTLVELMTTVALVGILAGVMVSYGGANKRNRDFDAAAQAVITATGIARGQAMATGTFVHLAIGPDKIVAFVDQDGDHVYSPGEDTPLFRYPKDPNATLPAGLQVKVKNRAGAGSLPGNTLLFDARGFAASINNQMRRAPYAPYAEEMAYYSVNICVIDSVTSRIEPMSISPVGWAGFLRSVPCP